jgi:hypothetical protein
MIIFDGLINTTLCSFAVIPAQAGIQLRAGSRDPRLRGDDYLRSFFISRLLSIYSSNAHGIG